MKSMSLEKFLKMLEENNSSNVEEFLKKVLDKAEEIKCGCKNEDISIEEIKQGLHKSIDAIENEKELQYFCYKMGMIIFDYFKEKVIGDDE